MKTVKPLQHITPITSTGSYNRNRGQEFATFASGFVLQADVIADEGENHFSLDFGNVRLTAIADIVLPVGQSLQLQVKQTQPRLIFEIIEANLPLLLGRSLILLDKNFDLGSLFRSLKQRTVSTVIPAASRQTLEHYASLQQEIPETINEAGGPVLKELIDSLGLHLEALLARGDKERALQSLKAGLFNISHAFSEASSITRDANRLLATIELFQLLQLQAGNDALFILPLPFQFLERGYLVVEYDSKKEKSGGERKDHTPLHFSLHLTFSPLGNMQMDFHLMEEVLMLRIRSENQEISDFLKRHVTELQQMISITTDTRITFTGDAPDPIQSLLQDIVPQGHNIFDTVI